MSLVKIKEVLNALAKLSECKDKQVAAISVWAGRIIGVAINIPVRCNGKCDHTCGAAHAEAVLPVVPGCEVYITLYPCELCQAHLYHAGVKKVYVFNKQHKAHVVRRLKIVTVEDLE